MHVCVHVCRIDESLCTAVLDTEHVLRCTISSTCYAYEWSMTLCNIMHMFLSLLSHHIMHTCSVRYIA